VFENYKIWVKKYQYSSETELTDINYFSSATKTLIETLDLTPYVYDDNNVEIESNSVRIEEKLNNISLRRMTILLITSLKYTTIQLIYYFLLNWKVLSPA
jgi:hypothetical protein